MTPPVESLSDIYAPPLTIAVARRAAHRPRIGRDLRVTFASATVDSDTLRLARQWQGRGASKLSLGVLLDQVFAFAKRRGFTPKK